MFLKELEKYKLKNIVIEKKIMKQSNQFQILIVN